MNNVDVSLKVSLKSKINDSVKVIWKEKTDDFAVCKVTGKVYVSYPDGAVKCIRHSKRKQIISNSTPTASSYFAMEVVKDLLILVPRNQNNPFTYSFLFLDSQTLTTRFTSCSLPASHIHHYPEKLLSCDRNTLTYLLAVSNYQSIDLMLLEKTNYHLLLGNFKIFKNTRNWTVASLQNENSVILLFGTSQGIYKLALNI